MKSKKNIIYLSIFIILFISLCIYIYYKKTKDNFNNETNSSETNKNGKIAFLFLTYSNLKKADIWNKFFGINNSDNSLYTSAYADKFTIYNHAKDKEQVKDILLKDKHIPEHLETGWGQFNLVECNILMMKQALQDPLNKKFILVSDSCIPIVSFDTFYNEIMKDDKSRININININNTNSERYDTIINPNFQKNEFTKHSGSGVILNLKHSQILVSELDNYKNNWKDVFCPDEHYISNILRVLDTDFNINNINHKKNTFDSWSKDKLNIETICNTENDETICTNCQSNGYSPKTITKISNRMIDELRNKNFLLLRKIDENTEIDINYLLK